MTQSDELQKIQETLATPGWKYIDIILKSILDENIDIVKREHKDMDKLRYSQAIIQIIENLFSELDLVERKAKDEINLIKKYKRNIREI
ncbi:MAG: hypothetical protein M0R00_06760 [Candidatus Omnitrophica bacterium]|jgi:hypothetical protein|nr:hypothetical protein [Candidatus Omnitrophota bacterium]